MFNTDWLREIYNNKELIVVISNKPRKNGHNVHLLRKDLRRNEWYEVSPKTGKELRNYYYCWWDIESWIEDGSYRLVDVKKEVINNNWRDWFLTELIYAIKEVEL